MFVRKNPFQRGGKQERIKGKISRNRILYLYIFQRRYNHLLRQMKEPLPTLPCRLGTGKTIPQMIQLRAQNKSSFIGKENVKQGDCATDAVPLLSPTGKRPEQRRKKRQNIHRKAIQIFSAPWGDKGLKKPFGKGLVKFFTSLITRNHNRGILRPRCLTQKRKFLLQYIRKIVFFHKKHLPEQYMHRRGEKVCNSEESQKHKHGTGGKKAEHKQGNSAQDQKHNPSFGRSRTVERPFPFHSSTPICSRT